MLWFPIHDKTIYEYLESSAPPQEERFYFILFQ